MSHATGQSPPAVMRFVQLSHSPAASLIGELMSAGAEVAEHEQTRWIRLSSSADGAQALLSKLAGQPYLQADPLATTAGAAPPATGLLLRRPDQQVPTASLPADLSWQAIDQVFGFTLPTAAIGSRRQLADRPGLRLERGGRLRSAAAISVSLSDLAAWTTTAAGIRLQPLRWLCREGQALVLGDPLPPLAGTMFVAHDQVLVPSGFQWQPALPSLSVLQAFCAAEKREPLAAWLIWETDQQWCLVDDSDWVALTRASVRAAWENR